MALSASTTLPASVERVVAVFTTEDFVRRTSEAVGGELVSFEVSGPVSAGFSTRTVRTLPTEQLPEMARKVVGATLTVTQVEQWSAPEPDGSRQASLTLTFGSAPLEVAAVQRIAVDGDGCRVAVTGEVTSTIPFMGAVIAQAAEPVVAKALDIQTGQALAWLQDHPA